MSRRRSVDDGACGPDGVPIPHGPLLDLMEYCDDRHTYAGVVAADAPSPALGVVEAVSAATGVDPLDLPPMADVLDPDALDDLLVRVGGARHRPRVRFYYDAFDVTVVGRDVHLRH
jgi:hypothetical protein